MKILIPVDGSQQGNAALDFVSSRAKLMEKSPDIQLLNVQPRISARVARAVGGNAAREFQRAQADDVLRPAVERLRKSGVTARASYSLGSRSDAIAAVAVRAHTDLIVMGSRGHSGLKGVLFGSMTNAVLAGCTKPLLILRSAKTPSRNSLAVGIAVDGSRYGQAAVRWVLRHRELFGVEPRFELIHVLDDDMPGPKPMEGLAYRAVPMYEQVGDDEALTSRYDKAMAGALRMFAKAGVQVAVVRLRGSGVGDAIAAHARKRRLDVLAMGSHGLGAFKSLVLGSVAMRVAARCDKPLLLIREPQRNRSN